MTAPRRDHSEEEPRVNGFTFEDAIYVAAGAVDRIGIGGETGPLADFIASDQPLSAENRQQLAELLRLVRPRLPRGYRGERRTPRTPEALAEYSLAARVLHQQKLWRRRTGKTKVPPDATKRMIKDSIRTGTSPQHIAWQGNADRREKVIEQVERLLRNPRRLRPFVLPRHSHE
jgi:hypothetical protein